MQRETILDKIRALLSKTVANGCTEAEMLAALAKARAMRDAHGVTDEELQLAKDDTAILYEEPADELDPHKIKWRLGGALSTYCDVKVFRQPYVSGLKFVGARADVEWATWLLEHLADFVFEKLTDYLIVSLAPPNERRVIIKGFVLGITGRISERMLELAKPPVDQTANARALLVVKGKAIADRLEQLGIKLRRDSSRCPIGDDGAYQAGREAGEGASFGRPVSGTAGVLRIAKRQR
jgi:Protein of unknown function (DUF2786)